MSENKIVSAEEARGCGDGGCVFRSPSRRGMHTNGGCRCLPLRMTPHERAALRAAIRAIVVDLDTARTENKRMRAAYAEMLTADAHDRATMDEMAAEIERLRKEDA